MVAVSQHCNGKHFTISFTFDTLYTIIHIRKMLVRISSVFRTYFEIVDFTFVSFRLFYYYLILKVITLFCLRQIKCYPLNVCKIILKQLKFMQFSTQTRAISKHYLYESIFFLFLLFIEVFSLRYCVLLLSAKTAFHIALYVCVCVCATKYTQQQHQLSTHV